MNDVLEDCVRTGVFLEPHIGAEPVPVADDAKPEEVALAVLRTEFAAARRLAAVCRAWDRLMPWHDIARRVVFHSGDQNNYNRADRGPAQTLLSAPGMDSGPSVLALDR